MLFSPPTHPYPRFFYLSLVSHLSRVTAGNGHGAADAGQEWRPVAAARPHAPPTAATKRWQVVAARPRTHSPATAPLARPDLEVTPLSRSDPAEGGGDVAGSGCGLGSGGGLGSRPWWLVAAEGGDANDDDSGDHEEGGSRWWLGLGFGFFLGGFFCAGDISHPLAQNEIFACGCITRTKKIRFLQTLGCRRTGDPHTKTLFDHTEKAFL